jgi:hypothetical protein
MNTLGKYVIHIDIENAADCCISERNTCATVFILNLDNWHATEILSAADTFVQVYLSILYLRIPETFKIILRGKVVEHHNVADDLMHPQYILYKPQAAGSEEALVVTTIGFLKEAPKVNLHGFCVYHKNRLIMPFWQVINYSSSRGRGVVGVLEANFVEPTHNKQDFEKTVLLQKLENRLKEMTVEYWSCHCVLIGYQVNKKPRLQIPQKVQPAGRQALSPPPGFQAVFPQGNTTSLPRVSTQPVLLEKRKEHPDSVASAALKRKVGNDDFTVPGHIRVEQFIHGSASQSQDIETVKLMEENKKLRAKCLDRKVRSQNLEVKAMNLRSELENYKSEYERLMVELQALDLVKDEHRRNVNT